MFSIFLNKGSAGHSCRYLLTSSLFGVCCCLHLREIIISLMRMFLIGFIGPIPMLLRLNYLEETEQRWRSRRWSRQTSVHFHHLLQPVPCLSPSQRYRLFGWLWWSLGDSGSHSWVSWSSVSSLFAAINSTICWFLTIRIVIMHKGFGFLLGDYLRSEGHWVLMDLFFYFSTLRTICLFFLLKSVPGDLCLCLFAYLFSPPPPSENHQL